MDKKLLFFFTLLSFILLVGVITYVLYHHSYKTETVKVLKIDEYGNAYLSNGETVQFRGIFICENGSEYYWENLNSLVGKELKIEYRVNEEGYKKVESFYINGVECEKTTGYGSRGEYYERD